MNDEEATAKYFDARKALLTPGSGLMAKLVARMRMREILKKYPCCSIPLSTSISSFTAPHGFHGVFISSGASVGEGCVIFQDVTIGSVTTSGSRHPGAPHIGNNCVIGSGARVIGGIIVGDGCRIGANCVVCEDVPPNSTVVLDKPRVIVRNGPMQNEHSSWSEFKSR